MFSVFATQGLEAKKKGEFTREELDPLVEGERGVSGLVEHPVVERQPGQLSVDEEISVLKVHV